MTQEEDKKWKKLDVETKLEADIFKTQSISSLRQRSMFKNPRIVRVSRAFGGKDRHSKVTTVKGLRDRRIRLSVPTAIQLYDLQDRLGLSQPSKVIDWLLAHSNDEIDKLPPLQMPHGNFNQFYNPTLNLDSDALKTTFYPYSNPDLSFFKDGSHQSLEAGNDEISENSNLGDKDKTGKSKVWDLDSSEGNQEETSYDPQVSAQNFFPVSSHSSFPNFLQNSIPYNSFYHLDPSSSLSLTQFGNHGFQNQVHERHSSLSQSLQSSGSQLYRYPPSQTPSIIYPNPQYIGASPENDARHSSMYLPSPFISPLNRHPQGNEKDLDENNTGS